MKTSPLPRLDLYKLLDSGPYDHAMILTYTFDPTFFEGYCLANLAALHSCKRISVYLDRATYNKIISGTNLPRQANLRYLLHPVSAAQVFHPKLVLLTSPNKGRLLFGSANFTRPGLTSNAELVGIYDFKAKDWEGLAPVFRSAFRLLKGIADRWPARNLTSNLQEMLRDSPWLEEDQQKCGTPELISNLDWPLLEQLISKMSGPMDSVSVVSRYFDESPQILDELVGQTAAKKIKIFTQNGCTTLPAAWLQHSAVKTGRIAIYLSDYSSGNQDQSLRGKAFALQNKHGCLFAFGSANCTTPALLDSAAHGNVEALMAVRLSAREVSGLIPRLLDPGDNAERLATPSQLVSQPCERDGDYGDAFPIEIVEAEADEELIRVWLAQPLQDAELNAKLEFAAEMFVRIPFKGNGSAELEILLHHQVVKRLGKSAGVISLEDQHGTQRSNRILITNLLDCETGMNARKARYVKEAEQNSVGLLSVLNDLRGGTDEDALRTFLVFCDIPLVLGAHTPWHPLIRQVSDVREGMRTLRQRDFYVALTLHELTLNFCERHFRKLGRHAADRRPEGIPNFLHIALAIGGVLESQIERALSGLEARDKVTTQEWADFRNMCDSYFSRYRELTTLVWKDYLSKLVSEFPAKRIREAFEPELQPLSDLGRKMLHFRDRVESMRTTKCLIHTENAITPYGYFQSVFAEQKWPTIAVELGTTNSLIAAAVMGEAATADLAYTQPS